MSSNTNPVITFRHLGFAVLPKFLAALQQSELRQACDLALERARCDWQETAHSTARISLLTDSSEAARKFIHERRNRTRA